jgi:hypothetical protein
MLRHPENDNLVESKIQTNASHKNFPMEKNAASVRQQKSKKKSSFTHVQL